MEVITIESKAFQEILNKIDLLNQKIDSIAKTPNDQILTNEEFIQLLSISPRTAQNYRDKGLVAFSKEGKKILYKMSDVQKFLDAGRVEAFKKKK